MSNSNDEDKRILCAECRRALELGIDVLLVEEGVAGPRGFVPLQKILFFCSEKCLSDYFSNDDLPEQPRRIP